MVLRVTGPFLRVRTYVHLTTATSTSISRDYYCMHAWYNEFPTQVLVAKMSTIITCPNQPGPISTSVLGGLQG